MDVRVQGEKTIHFLNGYAFIKPYRYILLHARNVPWNGSWPPLPYDSSVIQSFRIIPIDLAQTDAALKGTEVIMKSVKNRRELTDTIPIMDLTRQVLQKWVQDLTSWEVVGWTKETSRSSSGKSSSTELVQITIVARVQTNESGDFTYRASVMDFVRSWFVILGALAVIYYYMRG